VSRPAIIPVAVPEVEPIVAIDVLLLVHTPPVVASLKDVVRPTHKLGNPVIGAGRGFTVSAAVVALALVQPAPV